MSDTLLATASPSRLPLVGSFESLARKAVRARLRALTEGSLTVVDGDRRDVFGTTGSDLQAEIVVHDPRFYTALAFRGSVGAGEAHAQGWWDSDDLVTVIRLCVRNRALLEGIDSGLARIAGPFLRAYHSLRSNTKEGSRKNIAAHYDLGNDFFELFLDDTMTYSCGIFADETTTLREASVAKLDRACRKLQLRPDDHLLEIGTGWGSLALHAAERYGCRVTTTTISAEQHALASERIAQAGLTDRVTLLLEDYRDLTGRYDKLVSIEMIEAVGHQYLDTYFRTCSDRLAPDGLMLLQAITIQEQQWKQQVSSIDFIKRHVFPGSCLLSVATIADAVARVTDLKPVQLEEIGPHYTRTLRAWGDRLRAHRDEALRRGYSEERIRAWEFYLAYCEGGFAERYLGDVQVLLAKPDSRHDLALPNLSGAVS
ncbi:MAG: cyclopropane-fatty-acyl-phospholipid synthase family protein [Acidobacteriota bacterium]